jgi:hypothetical protein
MADKKFERYQKTLPSTYRVGTNPVITALIKTIADSDDVIIEQQQAVREQRYTISASGKYLEGLGSNVGVNRPTELGLIDDDYRRLIPVLSYRSKQIRKTFYDLLDIFWSPLFSRANVTTQNVADFALNIGDEIKVKINDGETQVIKVRTSDLAVDGTATAAEAATLLSRLKGATISIITDVTTGDKAINVRSDAVGPSGSVEFLASSGIGGAKLDFELKRILIVDLDQRVSIYEIENRELLIEIPAILPVVKRSLKGSHHFHADSTLEGDFVGSFLFSPKGSKSFNVTRQRAQLQAEIQAGNVYTTLTVDDTSLFENTSGYLIFNFGKNTEEQPVKYIAVPNTNTILIDPSHKFENTHIVGSYVNVIINSLQPLTPRISGDDYAIYMTSPAQSRVLVQELVKSLAAAGVIITFIIKLPEYKYLCTNPYDPDVS